jgi:hypothetical protein
MAILNRIKTDLSSFDYKKIETTRSEPSNVKNLPTPPSRVTEVETTIISPDFSKLANTDRGSNDVKQPSSAYLQAHRFNDGFGNIALTAVKTVEDVVRWTKWSITGKGIIFHIKQAVLQRQNARRETRIYNPLGVLGSVLPFVHLPRHTTGTFLDFKNPPTYPDDVGTGKFRFGASQEDKTTRRDYRYSKGPGQVMRNTDVGNKSKLSQNTIYGGRYGLGRSHINVERWGNKMYSVGISNQLQVPYGGTKNDKSTSELPKDFIKFRIRDLVNGKWLIFPAHLGTITDAVTPTYSQERYIGRPDAVHIYTGTDRSVSFDFKVAAFTKQEIPIIQEKMNYLMGLGYPTFKELFKGDSESRPVAPYISLTIGDLFKDTPGYFSGITITIEENATWEIDERFQIPQVFNVSVEFVYIGKYLSQTLGMHYEVPWLTDYGVGGKYGARGTYVNGDVTDSPVENTIRPDGADHKSLNWFSKYDRHFESQISNKAVEHSNE